MKFLIALGVLWAALLVAFALGVSTGPMEFALVALVVFVAWAVNAFVVNVVAGYRGSDSAGSELESTK